MFAMRTKERTNGNRRSDKRDHVVALQNGLRAMETFDAAHPTLSLSDVARRAGLTRAAARRYLHTLASLGYAETNGKHFRLGPRVLRLGYTYLSANALPGLAQPLLERVGEQLEEVASLAVLDGSDVVFLARSAPRRIVSTVIAVGTRFPALGAATGRVLLADKHDDVLRNLLQRAEPLRKRTPKTKVEPGDVLAEIVRARTQGYALNDEELELGLRSIAVPVRNRSGAAVAAISVSVQSVRMTPQQIIEGALPLIRQAASDLQALL